MNKITQQAEALLRFFVGAEVLDMLGWEIDPSIKQLPDVKSISGGRSYNRCELWGYVYVGRYRMRFTYDRDNIIGQEIYEDVDL